MNLERALGFVEFLMLENRGRLDAIVAERRASLSPFALRR